MTQVARPHKKAKTTLANNDKQPLAIKTKADIFISALLYGALERI